MTKVLLLMEDKAHQQNQRDLVRVVQFSSALAIGVVAAFLYSLKTVVPHLRFELSPGTFVAFVAGAALSWIFWRLAFRLANRGNRAGASRAPVIWFAILSAILMIGTIAAFIYSVKDVAREQLIDVGIGAGSAVVVLIFVGFLIWRVGRFFSER